MPPTEATPTDIAARLVSEHGGALVKEGLAGNLPQDALDAAQDHDPWPLMSRGSMEANKELR